MPGCAKALADADVNLRALTIAEADDLAVSEWWLIRPECISVKDTVILD